VPGGLVVLEPASWLNHPFPLLDEIDNSAPLRAGRWLVLFYHYDCSDCQTAIPAYEALANRVHIAFVAMPPLGQSPVTDSPQYLNLRLRPDHDWFATTPLVVTLEDGQVAAFAEGENAIHPPDAVGVGQ
jgi:thiol-disulfide isomerase/thioredoxin